MSLKMHDVQTWTTCHYDSAIKIAQFTFHFGKGNKKIAIHFAKIPNDYVALKEWIVEIAAH